jgi:CubicO group peptidase (beta-lactamase class C family)
VIGRRRFLTLIASSCQRPANLIARPPQPSSLDKNSLRRIFTDLERDPRHDLKGVQVTLNGVIQGERYFNGSGPDELHDIRSAGKSVTSLLAGIAIDQRLIASVREPITKLLGVAGYPDKARITLYDLLTMRSGLAANDEDPASPGHENRLDEAPAWLDFALSLPVRLAPGKVYTYCSVNAFLVGAAVEQATKRKLDDYASEYLFRPLGINKFTWRTNGEGRTTGQGNLSITVPDMISIGQLCLGQGMFDSKRVISASWINQSLSAIASISDVDRYADSYGYMWYSKKYSMASAKVTVHFASGNGGNKIYIIPQYKMVIAITSSAYGQAYGHRRSERILRRILAAVRR